MLLRTTRIKHNLFRTLLRKTSYQTRVVRHHVTLNRVSNISCWVCCYAKHGMKQELFGMLLRETGYRTRVVYYPVTQNLECI